jgi:hypothetical protein
MVTKEELEDILLDEQVKEIYDSIDTKELDRKEKEYKEYKEYTKKDRHPISHQVMIEQRSAPQYGITDVWVEKTLSEFMNYAIAYMALAYTIGLLFFLYMVLSAEGGGY